MNDNNTTVKRALRDIVAAYGVEVFTDVAKMNALLKDFIPQYDKERKLIILALKEGIGAELQDYASFDEQKGKQIIIKWEKRLVSDSWITEEAAHLVVGQLVEAVGITSLSSTEDDEHTSYESVELIKGAHAENENPNDYLSKYQIIGYKAFASNFLLEMISISNSIRIIRPKAFYNCINLRKIEIPSSIMEIGRKVFVGCSSLSEIIVSRAEKYTCKAGLLIDAEQHTLLRVANMEERQRITIPSEIQTLQEYALDESKAKQIILPQSLITIESNAFNKCMSLEQFDISASNQHFKCIEGVIHTKDCKVLLIYPAGSKRSGYVMEDGVIEVARSAFADALHLESVTFPYGLLRIGERAFVRCRNIRSIMLPMTVQRIGERAFQECDKLEHVMLPRGIEEIGDYAYSGCESLETLSIPRGVVRIGNCAFQGCKRLKRVVVQDKVSFIGDGAFDGCENNIEIAISNNPYVETYCRTRGIKISKI